MGGAQISDADSGTVEPCRRNAGREHERMIGIALVGEEIESRSNEVRSDPCVRHVADEARFSGISPDHFRPLVPGRRAPAGKKESEQFLRTIAPSKAYKGADGAKLVWCVLVPRLVAVATVDELAPIALVRRLHQRERKVARISMRCERDGRRRRIEITELGRAREISDAMHRGGGLQRCRKLVAKLIALR